MDRASLDRLQRQELIDLARSQGSERPEVMTRDELMDEILRLGVSDPGELKSVRGWFGVARDLLAGLVEQGLHLPDAAKVIRGDGTLGPPSGRRPLATVTLAEIYAAQGHLARGVAVLREVLEKEPEHEIARRLLSDLEAREAADSDKNYLEEKFEWTEAGPKTPAESPVAISERETPVLADVGAIRTMAQSPAEPIELKVKSEPDLEAPTLRTTQLREELPTSAPPELVDVAGEVAGEADAEADAEDTSPNASAAPLVEPVDSAPPEEAGVDASGDLESPDSCVLFVSGGRVVLSWRLAEASFTRRLAEHPDGSPIVRLVWWRPGLPASRSSLDVAVTQATGEILVEPQGYDPSAALRGALGWHKRGSSEFAAIAAATVCALRPDEPQQGSLRPTGEKARADASSLLFRPHAAATLPQTERIVAARVLADRYSP